jgi:hypothetical protein
MKIDIYQVPYKVTMQNFLPIEQRIPVTIDKVGYIELEFFDRDECWHLGNWTAWADEKPSNLYYEGRSFSVCEALYNPETDTYHLAVTLGWKEFKTLEEIISYFENKIGII